MEKNTGRRDGSCTGCRTDVRMRRPKKETGSGKKDDQEKAMGRYVEEDLKPPVQDRETPLGAYKKDGILHLYTSGASQDSVQNIISINIRMDNGQRPRKTQD